MKTSLFLGAALLCAAVVPQLHLRAQSLEDPPAATESRPGEARKFARSIPFRGKVAALDSQKMTFTLSGPKQRVFHLTPDTKIEKDGKPAVFADLAVGDEARGLYQAEDDGQLTVIKGSFGPKPGTGEAKVSAQKGKDDSDS